MNDTRVQRASLVGQVIEDLTYEALSPGQFEAQLSGTRAVPRYKVGGFFVFSDLRPGTYDLRLSGRSFQPQSYQVTIPLQTPIFYPPGDNELLVIVKAINGGGKKISFDPIILTKDIRAGAVVSTQGFSTTLTNKLEIGRVMEAKVDDITELSVGSIVRIVRESAIRLKLISNALPLPAEITQIVGKITVKDTMDIPLQGVQVNLTGINDSTIVLQDIESAKIATVEINGNTIILGTQKDIMTFSNAEGNYNLYFRKKDELQSITLEATVKGYCSQIKSSAIAPDQPTKIDFQLNQLTVEM